MCYDFTRSKGKQLRFEDAEQCRLGGLGRQRQAQTEEEKIIGFGTGFVFGNFIEREIFMVGGI